jgi:hypothetical protein
VSGRIKNPHTFDIPTIYLPNDDTNPDEIPNNIGECGVRFPTLLLLPPPPPPPSRPAAKRQAAPATTSSTSDILALLSSVAVCTTSAMSAEEMCEMIDTTISAAVQHSLNNLKTDCEKVLAALLEKEAADVLANSSNSSRRAVKVVLFGVCFLFSLVVPVCIALYKLETVFHVLTQLKGDDPESWVRHRATCPLCAAGQDGMPACRCLLLS